MEAKTFGDELYRMHIIMINPTLKLCHGLTHFGKHTIGYSPQTFLLATLPRYNVKIILHLMPYLFHSP